MNNKTNQMWGSSFKNGPTELMMKINQSVDIDKKLYAEDIFSSIIHVQMLAKQGIITTEEENEIIKGLEQIKIEIGTGKFDFKIELEDIHMNIESRLSEIIGAVAGKMHTARSRNDQVATDLKLYVKKHSENLEIALKELQLVLVQKAEAHIDTIMPGFTHLQTAQPISFAHYLMAYVEMFGRDRTRLKDAIIRMNECPLGSCALAGTSFTIDREYTAKMLGFDAPTKNSIDSVADRDFALEFLFACSIIALHLSRMAEEMIIFSNDNFGFIKIPEQFSSGSSIMPQKRNPDSMELIRAKSGRIYGNLTNLFITMKALHLSYNKDMQEDKQPIIDTAETMAQIIPLAANVIAEMQVNEAAMLKAASKGFSTATDLADWLVKNLQIPFRQAHHLTGQVVKLAEENQCALHELTIEQIKQIIPQANEDLNAMIDVKNSVKSRNSYGGTAPSRIKETIASFYKGD